MALFIQSANALVSRVAQWVGAIPSSIGVNATAFNSGTGVITTASNTTALVLVGDFIGPSVTGPYTAVLAVSSTTITISDPDGVWTGITYPTAILKVPTQSSIEIMSCIQLCELKMRTIELPALRSNPYGDNSDFLLTDINGMAPIPADMNKPILFFQQGLRYTTSATATGTTGQSTIVLTSTPAQTIVIGMSVTGTGIGSGATITNVGSGVSGATLTLSIANSGTVSGTIVFGTTGNTASQSGPWIVYDRVGDREIIRRRMIDQLYVRPFGVPRVIRASFSEVGANYVFTPNPGQNVQIQAYYQKTFPFLFSPTADNLNPIVQNNACLASFPEGYMYGTLWAYYDKNKNTEESQKWLDRFDSSYGLIEDQNFKGKWLGGDQHLTSEFQPRTYRYSFK